MKKKLGKAAIIIIVMAVLIVLGNSLFIIRENQYGIVKEFGRIEKVSMNRDFILRYLWFRK